ncbi:HNH endonuclease [Saccharibacillus sacchari]|uniref:HNH endonuclease n=1 Tax=Saccharibacillus sacchari TaxID=456493 RepID=UPI0004BB8B3B|nr:HNH endonuclease signature motif containing protein [Saccharibacillus sacchari]
MSYIDMKYISTYYYANVIQGVIENPSNYLVNLESIFGDSGILNYIEPFKKRSNLHVFIEFIIDSLFWEQYSKLKISNCIDRSHFDFSNLRYITPLEEIFVEYGVDHLSFMEWWEESEEDVLEERHFEEYYQELVLLEGYYEVIELLSEDVFYILFLNRKFLQEFNEIFSSYLSMCEGDDFAIEYSKESSLKHHLRKDCKLKRVSIPSWVKKAVYFRDRGACTKCGKDLSGYLSLENKENYDHIIPLNLYGFNDVTNIQLLCKECNSEKSGYKHATETRYQSWYEK